MTTHTGGRKLVTLAPAISILLLGCTSPKNEFVPPPPPEVTVAKPLQQTVTLYLEKTGETEAVENAEVRSRVRGFVEGIKFDPGQTVKQGDLLYVIEKDMYQAQKESSDALVSAAKAAIAVAKGQVATADAEVARSTREMARQESLLEQNATSKAEYDTALAAKESAAATLISANAAVEAATAEQQQAVAELAKAQLDLDYTNITAPISGRITKTDVKLGNLIEDGAELAAIVNVKEIFTNFTISDREALELQNAQTQDGPESRKKRDATWRELPVFIRRETDSEFLFRGHLDYIDREGIDAGTGTLAIRGIFDNPDDRLMPGLFVHVRIPAAREKDALLIPEKAISRSDQGNYVLVIGDENKVERRGITTGQILDGWALVEDGLTKEDSIIVEGLQRSRPGTKVSPTETQLKSDDSPFLTTRIFADEETPNSDSEQDAPVDPSTSDPSAEK